VAPAYRFGAASIPGRAGTTTYGRSSLTLWRLTTVIGLLLVCYVAAWLWIGDGGISGNVNGCRLYRFPGHHSRGTLVSKLFEPAYRADVWLRPRHWSWPEGSLLMLIPQDAVAPL
jgi:hypothetical protein